MRNKTVGAFVQNRIVVAEFFGDVVCVENGKLGGLAHAEVAHHFDVHPTDWKDAGATPGCSGNSSIAQVGTGYRLHRMRGKERCEVFANTNRAHTGAAAAVRDTKSFMQI